MSRPPPPRPPLPGVAGGLQGVRRAHEIALGLEARGDIAGALAAMGEAVFLGPKIPELHLKRAELRILAGDRAGAVSSYKAAAAAAPTTPIGRLSMARALLEQNRDEEAILWLRQTVARFPDLAPAHGMLAAALGEAGEFDAAFASFERAFSLDDREVNAYYDWVRARRLTPADQPLIDRMSAAARRPDLHPKQRMWLELARGKAADDLDAPGQAMAHWTASAEIAAALAPFDAKGFSRFVDLMIAHLTPTVFEAFAGRGDPSDLPILVVGLPRSGTTLVEQILSSHPLIAGAGELDNWSRAQGVSGVPVTDAILAAMRKSVGPDYLATLKSFGRKALRVTDKLPQNFQILGFAHLLYPNARFIHCRRSTIDTALSIYATYFEPTRRFPALRADIVHYVREYERLMAHWRAVLPADRLFEVDYETLTAEPESTIRTMVEFTGLGWDAACLAHQDNRRAIKTPSKWQARRPINRDSVERWRRFEPWLGELSALIP